MGKQAVVAFLPLDLGRYMQTHSTAVLVGREYALKTQVKHRLKYEHFSLIQTVIDKGWCCKSDKENHLEFMYVDDKIFGSRFLLVLKSAKLGRETWLVTFFRTNDAQINSRLRRAKARNTLLRTHSWD